MNRSPLNVLVVDDSVDDLLIITTFLSKIDTFNIHADTESNYKKARQKIIQNAHDLYIVDHILGPETGLELIRECTAANVNKPFILLSGKGDKAIDLEAAKIGVYDYLTKTELNTEMLERSLRYSVQQYSAYMAIAESERRYREIFNKSVDIIFVLNENFAFADFNPTMSALMGYSAEELNNQSIAGLFENDEQAQKFLSQMASGEVSHEHEIVLRTKSGMDRIFLASVAKLAGMNGKLQYLGILHDYTSIKKSLAEKLWTAKMEAKDNLVRSLAHEIRNPLTNINLSVNQLEGELSADERMTFTDIAKRNSQRINDLITELMSQSGQAVYKDGYLNVNQVMKSALSGAMDRMKFKKIEISERYCAEPVNMMGDKMKLEIAFLNIIINALEAMESGKGKLDVETKALGNNAVVRITDNGTGISRENLQNIFNPYFTKKKHGLGLGLANTRSIIEAHNGTIEVHSVESEGTTFRIKLKLD